MTLSQGRGMTLSRGRGDRPYAWVFVAAILLTTRIAAAHPFHISSAEMEFNAKTGRIEVSLKLHALDMERGLTLMTGKKVNLEKDDVDGLLQQYLERHYYLCDRTKVESADERGKEQVVVSKTKLHGKELETTWLWLYFELETPEIDGPLALVNSVLVDVTEGQINTVSVRHLGQRHALRMTAKKTWGEYSRRWLEESRPADSLQGGSTCEQR